MFICKKTAANVLAAATVVALSGCSTVPTQLAGDNFAAMTPQQASAQNARGQRVRWGGEIVKVEPKQDATCFEILSRELYADARPNRHDRSDGRFIACSKGFYDPAVYAKGRDLTVVGTLNGTEQHAVGEYNYTFSHVDADQLFMWPKYQRATYYDPWNRFYDPFWGNPYWGGGYYGGWWGSPGPIVIVRNPPPPKH